MTKTKLKGYKKEIKSKYQGLCLIKTLTVKITSQKLNKNLKMYKE